MYLRKRQKGMSGIGVAAIVAMITMMALFAFKLMPVYIESWKVDTLLESLSEDKSLIKATPNVLWKKIQKRMAIDSIDSVKRENFTFERKGAALRIVVEWEVQTPFMGNVDLLVYFFKEGEIS